jgi:hypothetical protein
MSIRFQRALVWIISAWCAAFSQAGSAGDCDTIHSIANEEGALSLPGYSFVPGDSGTRAMIKGDCKNPVSIHISTKDPAVTSAVGDGVVVRKIDINEDSVTDTTTGAVNRYYKTRFRIEVPAAVAGSGSRDLVVREVEFTPPQVGGEGIPGRLHFALNSSNGQNWNLIGRLTYRLNGQDYLHDFGSVYLNPGVPQRFEVLVEYSMEYSLSLRVYVPKLKVTHFREDGVALVVRQAVLPNWMVPIKQTQGIVMISRIAANSLFKLSSCLPGGCASWGP